MNSKEFRAELVKIMPGYDWTVHQSRTAQRMEATGTQSSGFNRLSTLSVVRVEHEGQPPTYEVKSAGYGRRAKWLHTNNDGTLARALRGLQDHYEAVAGTHRSHADALRQGRKAKDEAAYYLQDSRSYVGNCPMWWAKDGNGYTTRLDEAQQYTLDDAMRQHRIRPTDIPWPCSVIDGLRRPTVDMQHMGSVSEQVERLAAAHQHQQAQA